MKQNDLLSATSILSALLPALHVSQDIVFGFDRAGLNHLVGVAILLVIVCRAVLLRERPSGEVIMLLGGVVAASAHAEWIAPGVSREKRRPTLHLDSLCPRSDRCILGYPRGPGVARSGDRFVKFQRHPAERRYRTGRRRTCHGSVCWGAPRVAVKLRAAADVASSPPSA